MSNTDAVPSPGTVLQRSSVALFLFSAALCGALTVSRLLLLPRYTQVTFGGATEDASSLRERSSALQASILAQEHERDELILPLQDTFYRLLVSEKHRRPDVAMLLRRVENVAAQFTDDGKPQVFFERVAVLGDERSVQLQGTVRNAGPRSMTVLAQFTEALRALPVAASVVSPQFTRTVLPDGSLASPFAISFQLQS